MDPTVKYLLSLRAVRERAKIVGDVAQAGKLVHFDVHEERMDEVADFVTSVIKVRVNIIRSSCCCWRNEEGADLAVMGISAITARTSSILFLRMVVGSISRSAKCLALWTCLRNGKRKVSIVLSSPVAW
jgi:hypothetical protein